MTITPETRLNVALDLAPSVVDYIVSLNPHDFERLRKPLMRRLMAPRITLGRVAKMVRVPIDEMLRKIGELTGARTAVAQGWSLLPESPSKRPDWIPGAPIREVDLLPIDETLDADPLIPVMAAVKALKTGEVLRFRHKWEPQPFYDLWIRMGGLEWFSEQADHDAWWIWVRRKP